MSEMERDYEVAWDQRAALHAQLLGSSWPGDEHCPADPTLLCDAVDLIRHRPTSEGPVAVLRAHWRQTRMRPVCGRHL